jgi:riboflavin kinase/FMN adenylyltransferase
MDIVQGWADLHEAGVVLTIGVFDGVHLGHQALIRGVVQQARALGGLAVVLTFHPHPRSVVAPESSWGYLCSLEERIARIAELGPDLLMVLRFTAELAATSAEDFVVELLRHTPLHTLYVGTDFSLGRGKQGDVAVLEALGKRHGFAVRPAPQVCLDGQAVSSTRIRELVQAGQVREASRWLGRSFSLRGEVVGGTGRGRELGFPTANLHLHPRQVLPADGVYAARVGLPRAVCTPANAGKGNPPRPALAYVGRRPTFGENERVAEVHLLDFCGDLVGYELRAEFVERLRPERRFASVAELIAQMQRDAARARSMLHAGRPVASRA